MNTGTIRPRERIKRFFERVTKKNTLFTKTFSGLLLLSFVTVFFMGIWMNRVLAGNYRTEQARANLERLRQTEESMELVIEVLSQSMEETLWSSDFITCLVSPGRTTLEQSYRIIRQIGAAVSEDGLVKSAFLFSPVSGEVHNDRVSCPAEEFADISVIEAYTAGKRTVVPRSGRETETSIVLWEGRMFLFQELTLAEDMVGLYACEIDPNILRQTLASGTVLVYNADRESVFPEQETEGKIPDWEKQANFLTEEGLEAGAGSMTNGFYRYDSPENGWIYLLPMDTGELRLKIPDVLPMYAAAALLFLLISVFFDYYISNAIYRPVNRLMQLVSRDGGEGRLRGGLDEVDFLEEMYADAIGSQNRLEELIEKIAPEILDSMLKNLLVGKSLEESRVAQILEGVGNPFTVEGRFLVAACRFSETEDRKSTDVELNLHLLSIRKALSELQIESCRIYDIHTEKLEVAVVMCFPADTPSAAVKNEGRRVLNRLELLKGQLPYGFYAAVSSICQKLPDIRAAYKEALDQIQYRQYMESSREAEGAAVIGEDASENRLYLKERVRALIDCAAEGRSEDTGVLLSQILGDMRQKPELLREAEYVMDLLTDRAVALPLTAEEQELLESSRLRESPAGVAPGEETLVQLLHYAQTVLGLVRTYSRKSGYRYVRLAREYIEQHYADSSLSQNEVCEHIGISASYLSELFTEVGNEKFSGYLASFRVEKACQLLRTTNMTIQEIGFLCGFNSIQNFIRVFKKYRQVTPGKYREEQG